MMIMGNFIMIYLYVRTRFRFLPGGYKLYHNKASDNFEKACNIDSSYENLEQLL